MANPTGSNQVLTKIYESILNAIRVKVVSSVLPDGAATETTLASIDDKLTAATGTLSSVSASTSSVTLLSSNSNREGFILYNDSTTACFVAFSATATTSAFTVRIPSNGTYDRQFCNYTGVISGIWNVATGAMRVTELT